MTPHNNRCYQRLLAFYSPRWRAENGPATLSTLRESHIATGRDRPSGGDRVSFAVAGMGERLFTPMRSTGALVTALVLLATVVGLLYYLFAVIWDTAADWPGSVGPYTNRMPVPAAFYAAALVAAIAARDGAARLLAGAAAAVTLALTGIAPLLNWDGPGLQVAFAFVVAGLLATRAIRAPFAILVTIGLALLIPQLRGLIHFLHQTTNWFDIAWLCATVVVGAGITVLGWRTPPVEPLHAESLSTTAIDI